MPEILQLMKGSTSESLRTHSPAHHKCKMQCPERPCWEGGRNGCQLRGDSAVPVHSTPSTRATQPGRNGSDTSGVTQKPHKTSKHTDQSSGEKEVSCPQEWVQLLTDRLWTPQGPSDAPCSGHRPSNTQSTTAVMFYTLRFLNSNKSANIIDEILCLKYCTKYKSQVNCYILQVSQNISVIM